MGPYARAVAPPSPTLGSLSLCLAAAPAGTPESKRGSRLAVQAAERVEAERAEKGKALMRARRSLLEQEYCSIPLQEKVLLLEVCMLFFFFYIYVLRSMLFFVCFCFGGEGYRGILVLGSIAFVPFWVWMRR